jgi:hypothetical protein
MIHNLETDEIETIGQAADFTEAMALARRLGKVPKGLNMGGSEQTDDHIMLILKKGKITSGVGAVTPPKPKSKKTVVPPEKLVGPPVNPDAVFAPRSPVPKVPGSLNSEVPASLFLGMHVRPLDPTIGKWTIKLEVVGERVQEFEVRKDIGDLELLATAFQGLLIYGQEKVRIISKPLRMEDGALFRIERISQQARLSLMIHFWNVL